MQRLTAALMGQRLWVCRRCGWRARRTWGEGDIPVLPERGGEEQASADPELAVLDEAPENRLGQGYGQQARHDRPGREALDLAGIDAALPEAAPDDSDARVGIAANATAEPAGAVPRSRHQRQAKQRRRHTSRRRHVVGAIAGTAAVMGLLALLGLARGCAPGTTESAGD
jgi:hypothetical protein